MLKYYLSSGIRKLSSLFSGCGNSTLFLFRSSNHYWSKTNFNNSLPSKPDSSFQLLPKHSVALMCPSHTCWSTNFKSTWTKHRSIMGITPSLYSTSSGFKFGLGPGYPEWRQLWFPSVSPGKCPYIRPVSNEISIALFIITNSLTIILPQGVMVRDTEGVVKLLPNTL